MDNYTLFNVSEDEEDLGPVEYHPAWVAFHYVFFIVAGLFGVFGNCIALTALVTTPKLRNSCTALIGNLCVSDLITSAMQLFCMVPLMVNKGFPNNMTLCMIAHYIPTTTYAVSLTTLIFITFNRYFLITRPRSCYRACCGNKQVIVCIVLIWVFVFVVMILPTLNGSTKIVYVREHQGCEREKAHWLVRIITLSFFVIIPAFILVPVLYGLTIYAVRASHRRVHAGNGSTTEPSVPACQGHEASTISTVSNAQIDTVRNPRIISKRDINLARIPLLIFSVFACCWTPFLVYTICSWFLEISGYFRQAAMLFIWANSAINPYLYAWTNRNFRQAYRRLLARWKCYPK